MSWTDIFPVLDEEMIWAYQEGVSKGERAEFEGWFGTAKVAGLAKTLTSNVELPTSNFEGRDEVRKSEFGMGSERDNGGDGAGRLESAATRHIVSATLFWKHVNEGDPELPVPTREKLVDARRMGLVKRFDPWGSYIEPLFTHSRAAMEKHPEVTFRLYLAADLEFLIPELNELGWEVHLMKSPSIRYCPGGFWRFLALEEEDALVTVIDTDRMNEVSHEIGRTEAMAAAGLGLWRVPGYYNSPLHEQVRYRPILGGHFGARGGVPIRELIEAFIWHWRHETLPLTANIPGIGERPIRFSKWPNYGFDEWWQLAALYPRLAPKGTLTFIPSDARSLLLPADIEYAQWANPKSECVYF
jgi:hypothetical protein